jgi:hypothetical protein
MAIDHTGKPCPDANHGAGILSYRMIFGVNVGIHIPAPWSIWARETMDWWPTIIGILLGFPHQIDWVSTVKLFP